MSCGDAIKSVTHVADVNCYPCSGLNSRAEVKGGRERVRSTKRKNRGTRVLVKTSLTVGPRTGLIQSRVQGPMTGTVEAGKREGGPAS